MKKLVKEDIICMALTLFIIVGVIFFGSVSTAQETKKPKEPATKATEKTITVDSGAEASSSLTFQKTESKNVYGLWTKSEMPEVPDVCSSCERSLKTESKNKYFSYTGFSLSVEDSPEMRKIYPELAGKAYAICLMCILKSYGVKFKPQINNRGDALPIAKPSKKDN